jgi:DNA uptake protein ComE-like DNA-binding protein
MKAFDILRSYLGFTRSQMNGFWVLAMLCQASLAGLFWLRPADRYTPEQQASDQRQLDSLLLAWEAKRPPAYWKPAAAVADSPTSKPRTYAPPERRQSGERPAYAPRKPWNPTPFNLATADTTQLQQIRGIGSKLAARIVKFRDRLGGFYAVEQVREVYGLPPETADKLLQTAFLDPVPLRPLPVNLLEVRELAKHPYMPYKIAQVICRYRRQHGPFRSEAELLQVQVLADTVLQRLRPYLSYALDSAAIGP